MLTVTRYKRTIVPGTPFSPEAPASPCKQIQQESAARQSHWNGCQPSNWNFGSIYDGILSILPWGQQVRCLPWLHPDRWNPVNKINQHPRMSHRSLQHHSSWKCRFIIFWSTNSLCVPWCRGVQGFRGIHELPGKRGWEQDQHLMRDKRPVNVFNVCFSFLQLSRKYKHSPEVQQLHAHRGDQLCRAHPVEDPQRRGQFVLITFNRLTQTDLWLLSEG